MIVDVCASRCALLSHAPNCYHESMKQIITRVDDDLAQAIKICANRTGESVNSYVNRLLRAAVAEPGTSRNAWKAKAIADGRLISNTFTDGNGRIPSNMQGKKLRTPAGYVTNAVSDDRDER